MCDETTFVRCNIDFWVVTTTKNTILHRTNIILSTNKTPRNFTVQIIPFWHLKLYKHHDRDKLILENALKEWKELNPDRIVFTGDLVHSKNQMTPELINLMSWIMTETANICKCVYIILNSCLYHSLHICKMNLKSV